MGSYNTSTHFFLRCYPETEYIAIEQFEARRDDDDDQEFIPQYLSFRTARFTLSREELKSCIDELISMGKTRIVGKRAEVQEGHGYDRGSVKLADRVIGKQSSQDVNVEIEYANGKVVRIYF